MVTKIVHFVSHYCGPQECDCQPRCHQRIGDEIKVSSTEKNVTCRNCLSGIQADRKRGRMRGSQYASPCVAAAGRSAAEFSFTLDGSGFSGMPLERVAKYMTALAELAGGSAIFVRVTDNSIVFVDAGLQAPSEIAKSAETVKL